MVDMLSLPNELILQIYTKIADVNDAVRLSSANKRLRLVWLENENQIVDAILRQQIPSYEDAVELAILEETFINNRQISHLKSQIPIRFYIRRLLHIASLASSAVTAWTRWVASLSADNFRHSRNYTSPHASYYLVRKIVLALQHPEAQLRQALYTTLQTASCDAVLTHTELNSFLLGYFSHEPESQQHGIFKSEEDWTEEDEMEYEMGSNVVVEHWNHASDILHAAMQDKVHGYQSLEGQLFNDIQEQN